MNIHSPLFIVQAVATLTFLTCGNAAQEPDTSALNSSFLASPFARFTGSLPSRDLFESAPDHSFLMKKRQTSQCSTPGGPICDAIHCCEPGTQCCPGGCCPVTSACFGTQRCCPLTSTICPGQTACCPTGYSCCGSTCCPSGSICERNGCISQALKDKVVRFDIRKNNQELLKNMCNGMRGKNVETLTYRGPDLTERDQTRVLAGCVPGYCADLIAKGLIPADFNSCDEYPPASSLEGGNARPSLQRAINCIPQRQNSHQGGKFGGLQSRLRKLGTTFQRGDQFVISIDCDKVLGNIVPRDEFQEERGNRILMERDAEKVSLSGNETIDSDVLNDEEPQFSYILAPFGDLQPGTYSVKIQVTSGTTLGSFIVDNEGWNYSTRDDGMQAGQSQTYSFNLQYWTPGVGVFLSTSNNSTSILWNLDGTLGQPTPNVSSTTGNSPSGITRGGGDREVPLQWTMKTLTISILALIFASTL